MRDSRKEVLLFGTLVILSGLAAGAVAIVFRSLIGLIHNIFFYFKFSFHFHDMVYPPDSIWGAGVIVLPVIGGLIVAFLVRRFAPEARGSGVPEVIDAVYYKHSMVRPIVSLIKAIAAAITIGSGGSAGREGPIIQIGATVAASIAQLARVPEWQRMTLLACGAGGGIAATFNTPLAGILFAVEIILAELSVRTILSVCIATALATYVGRLEFGSSAFFDISPALLGPIHWDDILVAVSMSFFLGVLSYIFIRSIDICEDVTDKIPGNYYIRHGLAMLLVGIILYLMMMQTDHYYLGGVGYASVLELIKGYLLNPGFLLILVGLKIVVTALTLGSGGSGGVFSPLLFIGAAFGVFFALICNQYVFMGPEVNLSFAALAGIAGLVAATTSAPLTAVLMTVELVHDYQMILPFIMVAALSYAVRFCLIKDSVYTMKLSRRSHHVPDIFKRMRNRH